MKVSTKPEQDHVAVVRAERYLITNLSSRERIVWLGYLYLVSFGVALGLELLDFPPNQTLPAMFCGPFAFLLLNPPFTWVWLTLISVVVWLPAALLTSPWLVRLSAIVATILWLLTGMIGTGLQV